MKSTNLLLDTNTYLLQTLKYQTVCITDPGHRSENTNPFGNPDLYRSIYFSDAKKCTVADNKVIQPSLGDNSTPTITKPADVKI